MIKRFLKNVASVLMLVSFAAVAQAATLPKAEVSKLPALTLSVGNYSVWNGSLTEGTVDRQLQVVMNFKTMETAEEARPNGYLMHKCDFYLTFTGIKDESKKLMAKDCFLAGNYGDFGWIVIPTDDVEIEEGVQYPVVAGYDANITYKQICESVKNFTAAIHVAPAILEANPDFKVKLELRMTNPDNADDYFTVGEPAIYTADELKNGNGELPDATVSKLSALTLAPNSYSTYDGSLHKNDEKTASDRPLQIVMNFKANDTEETAKASGFDKYLCDFYLKFTGLKEGKITADNCYLAGNYGDFGWIVIPADGLELKEGVEYPVVSGYDATLNYKDICKSVKDFTAAIHVAPAILEANPDFKVSLALRMTHPENKAYFNVGAPIVYSVADLKPVAKVVVPKAEDVKVNGEALTASDKATVENIIKEFSLNNDLTVGDNGIVCADNSDEVASARSALVAAGVAEAQASAAVPSVAVTFTEIKKNDEGKIVQMVFDVTPAVAVGDKSVKISSFSSDITFRLPVYSENSGNAAKIYHDGVFAGVYAIKGEGANRYVEISSKKFSSFAVEAIDAVACIGEKGYATLEEAVSAAAAGQTINLVSDVEISSIIIVDKKITLNLGESTISATGVDAIKVRAGGNLTINADAKNPGGITSTKAAIYASHDDSAGSKTIVINGGIFNGSCTFNKWSSSGAKAQPLSVTINGGHFKKGITVYRCYYFTANDGTFEGGFSIGSHSTCKTYFNGGLYKSKPSAVVDKVFVNGVWYKEKGYNRLAKNYDACEALVGTAYYRYLAEAISGAANNGTVSVLKDVVSGNAASIELGKTVVLDLAGKSVTGNVVELAGAVTVQNGTLADGAVVASAGYVVSYDETTATYTAIVPDENAEAILDGVNYVEADDAIKAAKSGSVIELNGTASVSKKLAGEEMLTIIYGDGSSYDDSLITAAKGFKIEKTVDGSKSVYTAVFDITQYEARVDDKYYLTISEAFSAVDGTSGRTIVVMKDVASGGYICNRGAEFTLDLNGHSVSLNSSGGNYACNFKITIADSSDDGDGVFSPSSLSSGQIAKIEGGQVITTKDISEKCAEGMASIMQSDGTYAVREVYAKIGTVYYETFNAAMSAAVDGDTVTLLNNVAVNNNNAYGLMIEKAITIDGNGKTITVADGYANTYALMYLYAISGKVTIKNLTFDGVKSGAAIWAHDADVEINNCVFQNGEHTQVQGLVRTTCANLTVKNSQFKNNNCNFAITFNYDAAESDTMLVENCDFVGNTVNDTSIVYYVDGASSTIKDCTFVDNTVKSASHGAVVYYSNGANGSLTGNVFSGNKITAGGVRASVLALEAGTTASENAFVDNTCVSTASGTTYVGTVLNKADADSAGIAISGNYWGGSEPDCVNTKGAPVVLENYYTTYESGVLGGLEAIVANVAKIGDTGYASIQEAIDAARSGDTIEILADVALDSSLYIPAEMTLTLDGNGHKLTPAAGFASNDHRAVLVLANGDKGYSSASKYTIKNLAFEGFSNLSRVIRANFCDAAIENCTFAGNAVVGGVITSAEAELTVTGCEFDGNTVSGDAGYGVIDIGSDVGAGTTVVANITGNVFTDNTVEYAVVFLFSSANVTGNYFNGNIHAGSNPNAAAILAGPYTGNMAYEINITDNAFDSALAKDGAALPSVFAEDWSSLGATTAFDLSSNYWGGEKPVKGGDYQTNIDTAKPALDSYYTAFSIDENGAVVLDAANKVAIVSAVAQIGDEKFASVLDAIDYAVENGSTEIKLLADSRELMPTDIEIILKANLTISADAPVTAAFYNNGTSYDFVIDCEGYGDYGFTIDENVTFVLEDRIVWVGYYGSNIDVVVDGTLSGSQIWAGGDIYVNGTGTLKSTGEAFVIRRGKTVFVDGGKIEANYFNILSGNIFAENGAEIECGALWIANTGSYANEGNVSISLWNSTLTAKGNLKSSSSSSVYIDVYDSTVSIEDVHGYGVSELDANTTLSVNGENGTLTINKGINNSGTIEVFDGGELTVPASASVTNNGSIILEAGSIIVGPLNMGVEVEASDKEVEYVDGKYIVVDKKVAQIGETFYVTLQAAVDAAQDGDTITLLADIELADTVTITKSITVEGNGKTVTTADGFAANGSNAMIDLVKNVTFGNIVFDGVKNVAVMRSVGGDIVMDQCVVKNCNQTVSQGLLRLACCDATITDCQFVDNTCTMVVSFGYDAANDDDVLLIDGCSFERNTCKETAVVYMANGDYGKVTDTLFADNNVSSAGNAATLYMGWGYGSEVSGCTFKDNTVVTAHATTKRFASAVFCDGCIVKENAFIGNAATRNGETIATIVAVGAYYGAADISANYWGKAEPDAGVDFTVEYTRQDVAFDSYYTSIDEEGNLGNLVEFVARIGVAGYSSIDAALAAAMDGDTVVLLADATIQNEYVVENKSLTIAGAATLTFDDTLKVKGESTLNISAQITDSVQLLDGTILKDSTINGTVFVAGNVLFRGANTVKMVYDYGVLTDYYGTSAPMCWTVEPGASLVITDKARYGLGYGDQVTIKGNLSDAKSARSELTDADASLVMHGLVAQESKGWNKDSSLTVNSAYVRIGDNNSFGNKPGNYGGAYQFKFVNSVLDASRITFYEALSTTEFLFKDSDVKMGTFMTRDADSVFTLDDTVLLSTATSNGSDEGNYHAGKLVLSNNSRLTYSAEWKVEATGVVEMDATCSITAPMISGTGKIVIDARTVADIEKQVIFADMTGFTGAIEVVGGGTYQIVDTGVIIRRPTAYAYFDGYYYDTFKDAFNAAVESGMSKVLIGVLDDSTVGTMEIPAGKSIVLDLGGNTLAKADGAKIVVDNAIVKFANGALDGFSASDVEIKGDSVATFPAGTVELSAFADTFYKTTNEDGSVSVATKFRSFIQVESGVPCIGFLKNANSEYKVYGKAELTDADWTLLEMNVVEDVVSDNPALPLKWFVPAVDTFRFFKVEMVEEK